MQGYIYIYHIYHLPLVSLMSEPFANVMSINSRTYLGKEVVRVENSKGGEDIEVRLEGVMVIIEYLD